MDENSGLRLGRWIRRQRELYASGELRDDRVKRLQELGIDLSVDDPWEKKFQLAREYSAQHDGKLDVPHDYIVNGIWLHKWLNEQRLLGEGRRKKKLTDDQKKRLESIGMVFGATKVDLAWDKHFQAVKNYVDSTGMTVIPQSLRDDDGVILNSWVKRQLMNVRKGLLSGEKVQKLRSVGVVSG